MAMDIIRSYYYIQGPWGDGINFCGFSCGFSCATLQWAIHIVTLSTPVIYNSGSENVTDAILEFYFRFRFWPCIVRCMWFRFGLSNFIQIGPPMVELWHHVNFQDGARGVGNLLPISCLVTSRISPRYLNPRMRYYYFRFLKTNGRHLENLHLFSFSPSSAYGSALDYQISVGDGFMSYRFSKMTAAVSEIYFWFKFWWRLAFEKVKDYPRTKFCQDISIHGWYITTSGFYKQTAAILKFYNRFPFWCLRRHGNAIFHWYTKFRPNRTINSGVMTSITAIFKKRPSARLVDK